MAAQNSYRCGAHRRLWRRLLALLIALGVPVLFCHCQQRDPYAVQAPAGGHHPSAYQPSPSNPDQIPHWTYGGGAEPRGQRLQPHGYQGGNSIGGSGGSVGYAHSAPAPAPAPTTTNPWAHAQVQTQAVASRPATTPNADRWRSGQTWAHRLDGQGANWRGSGVGWQRGKRKLPGHYSRQKRKDSKAPSTPANNWQTAPYYANTPSATSASSYGSGYQTPTPPPGYGPSSGAPASSYTGGTSTGNWGATTYDPYAAGGGAPSYDNSAYAYGGVSGQQYVIQKGDTLSAIARNHQVSLGTLLQANGLTRDDIIFPGQPVTIPGR